MPRAEHTISRDSRSTPTRCKVLYRLHQNDYVAYLVGGSVRDLLLGRRPKDFDIGTSAHPYQVKKLFRNCWIIGRRFRLAHVRFGTKTIEVATFRRQAERRGTGRGSRRASRRRAHRRRPRRRRSAARDRLVHRDNTFGTPEEDAFRRDFTINALFYDIATFSIIDYTGGLRRPPGPASIRCIGDPNERFRRIRSACCAPSPWPRGSTSRSIRRSTRRSPRTAHEIAQERAGAPDRGVLQAASRRAAERAFRMLAERRLLEPIAPELQRGGRPTALWRSLAALDAYRRRFDDTPDTLTNAILLGSLLVPLGHPSRRRRRRRAGRWRRRKEPRLSLGMLPLARRDVERLRQVLGLQRRLRRHEPVAARAQRALTHRGRSAMR